MARPVFLTAALLFASCSVTETGAGSVSSIPEATSSTTSVTAADDAGSTVPGSAPASTVAPTATEERATAGVRTGAAVLADAGFASLEGLRVGAIVNQTSTVDGIHLLDLLDAADGVELVAAFAPEHGVRGSADAGEVLDDETDPTTGVPVYSLYGATRQPTPEMLAGIDVLLFDLQDVGARVYTYISTMGLAMQAAAEAGVRFVVLDRPNPVAHTGVAGFVRDPEQDSFIGFYPVPMTHGMTTGELALAAKGEGWLDGLGLLDLEVVAVDGWSRSDHWIAAGLEWVPPSPGLPTVDSALLYPGTVLIEATSMSYGSGTLEPFTTVGAPWADGEQLAAELNGRGLPGVRFEPTSYVPEPIPDMSPNPRLEGIPLQGVRMRVIDAGAVDPVLIGLHVLDAFRRAGLAAGEEEIIDRPRSFDRLAGTDRLRSMLVSGTPPDDIATAWSAEVEGFETQRAPYLLYG